MTPVNLEAGMRVNPIGVEQSGLVFGWTLEPGPLKARALRQSAYRIVVASSAEELAQHVGDVWDSGRVQSSAFWQLSYGGPALRSHTTYFWQAQVWDGGGAAGPWSAAAQFTTGLLTPQDWAARWIAARPDRAGQKPEALPVFRHGFRLRAPVASALLYVSGLGQYEVHLNGKNVTDTVLNPGWTNYRATVPYDAYEVSSLLHPGANAFGVLLGNGMYNVERTPGRYTKFVGSFGQPKCILQLEVKYRDGSSERFVSDGSWQTHTGPVTFSSIYGGEDFDARALPARWDRAGFDAQGWQMAAEVSGPGGKLAAEESSPMAIAQTYKAVTVTHPKPGVAVYDLGETMSGWPEIVVRGLAGSTVTLLPGELLAADGTVSQHSTDAGPGRAVLYQYTLRGDAAPESWHPRFTYHSFRYVQVTAAPAALDAKLPEVLSVAGDFVHARAPVVGTFTSSDTLFNQIHTLIDRAVLSNLASVETDCPSREKLGWLEQTYLNAATILLNFDAARLYEKMSRDMADAQLENGLVPSIAPEFVAFVDRAGKSTPFRDSPEWGSAVILSPWALYQLTGDLRPLRQGYANMQRYAAYLEGHTVNGLLDFGLGDWYDIGPKPPGPSQLTSKSVTATGVYYEDLQALARIAKLLGHEDDAATYSQKAANVRDAYNAALFHPETNQYDRGSQTADALPLALGMVPAGHAAQVLANLVADIHAQGDHVTAGDIGFHYVVRALTDGGRSDVLAAMFSRTDSPSYGYQIAHGATTLTEAWDTNPNSSQNHFMLGHGEEWFYRGLTGLSVDMARGPDDAIQLTPSFLSGVSHSSATYRAPVGEISLAWERTGKRASVHVSVPAGAQAHLRLPSAANWRENVISASHAAGVLDSHAGPLGLQLTLGSGTYDFSAADFNFSTP